MTIYTDPEENEDYGFVFPPHGHRPPEIRYPRPRHRHRHHHPLVSTPLGMGPRGPQGETFTFDDLTDEQLAELREDVASVYHRKLESVYTTTGESTSQIPIPWDDFDPEKDMLFVRIEGLWLHANEYIVSEGNIVLTTPITHAGTAVGITMITTVAMSVEDLENLRGEDGFSPTVIMVRQNDGTLLSITDADGTMSALIPDGATGPIGQTGPVGPVGPQGPKGDKGDKGDVGLVGPKGQKGDKGDKGDAGLQGPKGDTGDQGPQGVTGPVGPQGEQGPQGIAGNDGTSPLAIDVGTDSIIVHCDSEGKTAKAETTGFNVYAHVGTVTHAVSLTVTCPPHGIPSWLNVYVGSYSVNVSWQEGVAAEDALLVLTVSTTNADGDLVTQNYPIHVITILDGAPGVSPTASVERVEGGALVTVTDASGTTTAMLNDAEVTEGSITDAMLAPDGIKAHVSQLWGNQLTKELTGEILTAADAYAAPPMALTVDGKSTQVTTTGKNLLDAPDITLLAAGYIFNGDVSIPAGTYTMSFSGPVNSASFAITDSDGNTMVSGSHVVPYTFTLPSAAVSARFYVAGAGTYKGIQIEAGSTATAYEPYTGGKPSPSPEYPQEIVSVEHPVLTFAGKNLFDKDNAILYNGYFDSMGYIMPNDRFRTVCIPVLDDTTYTISRGWADAATAWEYDVLPVAGADGTAGLQGHPTMYNTTLTFTTQPTAKYICISLGNITQIDYLAELATLQLEVGSTATAYEPYEGHTVQLYDGTLRSLPDGTKDTLALSYLRPSTREGWAWYSVELIQRVLNANLSNFTFASLNLLNDGTGRVFRSTTIDPNAITDFTACTCDHLTMKRTNMVWENMTAGEGLFIVKMLVIAWPDADATATEVKSAVSDYEFLYGTTAPITTQLDPIELPFLPAPTCTVWADPTTGLRMEYVRDTNLAYAQLEAALADLATS